MEAISVYQAGAMLMQSNPNDLTATARHLREIAVKPANATPVQLMVRVRDVRVDREYQRFASPAAAKKIARNLKPQLLGSIIVSLRADGEFYVIDGQHRVLALEMRGELDRELPALCYEGLTQAEEAWIFSETQTTRRRLTALDIFRADLVSGEPDAHDILRIVEAAGYGISSGEQPRRNVNSGHIEAIESLRKAYAYVDGPALLARTLQTCAGAWGTAPAPAGRMISGLASFLNRFDVDGAVDYRRLIGVLASHSPSRLLGDAKADADVLQSGMETGIAHRIYALYQKNLKTNRLPAWDEAEARRRSRASVASYSTRKYASGEAAQ